MAESWMDVLAKVSKKKNPKAINIVVLQPPKQPLQEVRMGYTGAGANGIVEPMKPAMFDAKTGSVYHEGEGVLPTPGGKQIVPASQMPGMITPATEMGQARLNTLEVPGFASGGYAPNYDPSRAVITATNQARNVTQNALTTVPPAPSATAFAGGTGPTQSTINAANQNAIPAGTPGYTGLLNNPSNPNMGLTPKDFAGGTGPTPGQLAALTPPPAGQQPIIQQPTMNLSGVQPFQAPVLDATGGYQTVVGQRTRPAADQPMDLSLVTPPTGPAEQTPGAAVKTVGTLAPPSSIYKTGAEEGFGQIRDISRGQSAVNADIRSRTMNYLDANAAANDSATIARLRSEGASPEEINAYMLNQNRSNEIQRAGAMKDIAISEGQRAEGASRDLTNLGRSAYEADRSMARTEKLDAYNQTMDRVNLALKAGDYATAGAALTDAFPGTTIDFGKLVTAENSKNFDAAVQSLSSYVKMGIDVDKIPAQARATILQAFGGNEYEMEQFYESLKQQGNVFEEELNAIMQYYPDATPAERNDIATALRISKANELGLKTDPKTGRIIGFEVPGEIAADLKPPEGVTVGTNKVYVSQNGTLMRNVDGKPEPVTDPTALDKIEEDEILTQYPDTPIANSIIQRRVQNILDMPDTATKLDLSNPADKKVYDSILTNFSTKDGIGDIGNTDLKETAKNENYTLTNLQGLAKNAPVKLNGRLYFFDHEEEQTVTGSKNPVKYFLRDAATGEMYMTAVIESSKKGKPEVYPLSKV